MTIHKRLFGLMKQARLFLVLLSLVFIAGMTTSYAEYGDVLIEYNLEVSKFALDTERNRLYASLYNENSIAVIDTVTLNLVNTVFVGSNPVGLAISADGNTLYIATSGASMLAVMDLNTLELLPNINLPTLPYDIEVGNDNRLFIAPAVQSTGIMQVNVATGEYIGDFSLGVFVYHYGMLEISPDRNTLYFANSGLSPGTLAKYDVSTLEPQLLYKNSHGSLGSNGQDLALTQDGEYISYAVGGGNNGYVIYKMRTSDFAVMGSFDTGAYPSEITYSPDGITAYTVHTSGQIDVFDAHTFMAQTPISAIGEADELIADQSGGYLFAAFSNVLRVYDVGGGPVDMGIGGSLERMEAVKIKCINQTTGQNVVIKPEAGAITWDCAAAGLEVNPGDKIKLLINGFAD